MPRCEARAGNRARLSCLGPDAMANDRSPVSRPNQCSSSFISCCRSLSSCSCFAELSFSWLRSSLIWVSSFSRDEAVSLCLPLTALIWLSRMSFKDSRRLQLAALSGKTWGIIFRPMDAASLASSSPLKIGVEVSSLNLGLRILKIRILKARGGFEGQSINLKF